VVTVVEVCLFPRGFLASAEFSSPKLCLFGRRVRTLRKGRMSEAQTVEMFLASSQDDRADLLTRWTVSWAREGAPFSSCLSALLEASMTSPVRLQQIDNVVSTTLVSLLLERPVRAPCSSTQRAGISASAGAAVAAAQFLAIHPTGSRLQDALCNELRSQAETTQVHGAIALLARQQALQGPSAGKPRSIAMELLESRIADYKALATGASGKLQQQLFADLEQLKGLLPMSPYFGPCTSAFAHPMLSRPREE
jgi:hypothetical protein